MILYPSRVLADFELLGIEIEGLAELVAISKAMAEAAAVDPADELAAEIAAGSITPKNAGEKLLGAASRQVAATAAQEVYRTALVAISKRTRSAVAAHAGAIVAELQPRFTEAADRLASTVGVRVPAKAKQVLSTPGAAAAHARRSEASQDLSRIAQVRTSLATQYRWGDREPTASWWIAEARDLDALDTAERLGRNWYALLEAGFTLQLNDPTQSAKVTAAATAATDRANRAREAKASERDRRIGRAELEAHQRLLEEAKA